MNVQVKRYDHAMLTRRKPVEFSSVKVDPPEVKPDERTDAPPRIVSPFRPAKASGKRTAPKGVKLSEVAS